MIEGYKKCELGNDLEFVDDLVNEMFTILVEYASDDFWKILKYGEKDALTKVGNTISQEDKGNMVKQNNYDEDSNELTRIKMIKFNDNISTIAHSEIRIFNGSWNVPSTNNYVLGIGIEIISHNDIIVLDGVGKTTLNMLRHEILKIFNNAYVNNNVGKMSANNTRGAIALFNSNFQGYQFTLISSSA